MAESSSWKLLSIIAVKHYSGYYLACTRCKRKARKVPECGENNKEVYKCPRCVSTQELDTHTSRSLLEWRYCVAMIVNDGHMHSHVVAFGDILNPVLGVSAAKLHQFLLENSREIFGRSEFDQTEVPELLHPFLQRFLIGRYFKFLVQHSQPMHNCTVVSRIVPLQTQLDIDLLTLLKCSYLGHELTKNESSVNFSACHTPFSDQRELLYSRGRTKDLSLIEIRSFTADESDSRTAAQTTQQSEEDTSLALELLCDFFTPLPSATNSNHISQQPLSSLAGNPSDETDSQERLDFDFPSDLDLQLEIVEQLEADWLLTQTQPCTSFTAACTEHETNVSSSFDPKFITSISLTDECEEIYTFSSHNLEHKNAVTQSQSNITPSSATIVEQSLVRAQLFSPSTEHANDSRLESPELFSAHPTPSTDQLTPIFNSQNKQQYHTSPNHSFTDCRPTLRPLQLNYSSDNSVQQHLVTSSTPIDKKNSKRSHSTVVSFQQQERSSIKRKKYHHSTSRAQTPSTTHCDSTNPGFSPDIL